MSIVVQRTGHAEFGDECPVRISNGDGGVTSSRISTLREFVMPNSYRWPAYQPLMDEAGIDAPVLKHEKYYVPIIEAVKLAYYIDRKLGFAGFAEAFCAYLRAKRMQTHFLKCEFPMFAVRFPPPSSDEFTVGAWYFGKYKWKDGVILIQVLGIKAGRVNDLASIRQVYANPSNAGRAVNSALTTQGVVGMVNVMYDNTKPLQKLGVSPRFTKQLLSCKCCTRPREAVMVAKVLVCSSSRAVSCGRIFE